MSLAAFTTSASRSTASGPVRVRATTHISVTPGIGCAMDPPTQMVAARRERRRRRRLRPAARSGNRRGSSVPGSGGTRDGRDPEWKGTWGPDPRFAPRSSSSPITRARRSRSRSGHDVPLHHAFRPPHSRRAREPPAARTFSIGGGPVRASRLPCGQAHRPHAHRGHADPARPRRTPLGRTGAPRKGLRRRGHLLAQRRHALDVHPCACLNPRRHSSTTRSGPSTGP